MNFTDFPIWISPSMTGQRGVLAIAGARRGSRDERTSTARPLWQLESEDRRHGLPWSVFAFGVVLILLAAGGGFLYIRQITTTTSSGYDLSTLERRAGELRTEEAKLQLETAELQSLRRVEERLPKLNLLPSEAVSYTSPIFGGRVTGQVPLGTARE